MNSIPRYDPTAGRLSVVSRLLDFDSQYCRLPEKRKNTRDCSALPQYRAWRDRSGVQMELGLRLQRPVDASTRQEPLIYCYT